LADGDLINIRKPSNQIKSNQIKSNTFISDNKLVSNGMEGQLIGEQCLLIRREGNEFCCSFD